MKKCVVIYNPVSGKEKNKECIEDFYTILKKYDYDLELIYTKKQGDAKKIIKELAQPDLVIVAGGDGTLNEVINGNIKRKERLLLGVLPLGTTNDVGNMLGYTKDYVKNLDMLLNGKRCKYDIGSINNHSFVYVASLGSLTNIPYTTPQHLKRKFGHFGYFIQAIKEIPEKIEQFDLRYKINGKTYQGIYSYVFITNTSVIGGKKNIYKDIKLDDHLLEVAFVKAKSKFELLRIFYYVMTSQIEKIPFIELYKTSNVEITFNDVNSCIHNCTWCVDGERLDINSSKMKISVNSDNTMLVPNKNIIKLFR